MVCIAPHLDWHGADRSLTTAALQELQESKAEADRLRRANEASEERLASLCSSAKCSHWKRLVQRLCTVKDSHSSLYIYLRVGSYILH